jgi:hypothetical protein
MVPCFDRPGALREGEVPGGNAVPDHSGGTAADSHGLPWPPPLLQVVRKIIEEEGEVVKENGLKSESHLDKTNSVDYNRDILLDKRKDF